MSRTSSPKKPNTGHAPSNRNAVPATKLMPPTAAMTIRNPARLRERCGVTTAEKSAGSAGWNSAVGPLRDVIEVHYRSNMGRRANPTATKVKPGKASPRAKPKRGSDPAPTLPAGEGRVRGRPRSKTASKPKAWTEAEVEEAFRRLRAANPQPRGELQYINPFTLLIAVVLSAQATDAGVNKATPALFAAADTPEKMVALGEDKVQELIKTIGLYRTKARNIVGLSRKLLEEHGGEVPRSREALEALPGVGRKTANVVLNVAFGEPTIAVDTHIFRVGNRTGLATGKTPLDVEMKLDAVVPDEFKLHAHHWLILHGRYVCVARRPLCEKCLIADLCKWPGKVTVSA